MSKNQLSLAPRESEILSHYRRFLGQASKVWHFTDFVGDAPDSIWVAEFAPPSKNFDWVYLTLGMSSKPMVGLSNISHRIELLMYSRNKNPEIPSTLASLAAYSFKHHTYFAPGHTIAGTEGVIAGSDLTDCLLTPVYFESEAFDYLQLSDSTHVRILCIMPIHRAERMYALVHGWRNLVENVFIKQEINPGDLFRSSAVDIS